METQNTNETEYTPSEFIKYLTAIIILFIHAVILWYTWNNPIVELFNVKNITFENSIILLCAFRIFFSGTFSR